MLDIQKATFIGKDEPKGKIPSEASVKDTNSRLEIEEIENGYIIENHIHIRYTYEGEKHMSVICKKYYSKKNPLNIDADEVKKKTLANILSE